MKYFFLLKNIYRRRSVAKWVIGILEGTKFKEVKYGLKKIYIINKLLKLKLKYLN